MKSKFRLILLAVLILTLSLAVFGACNAPEQSLDGLYIVTFVFNGGALDMNGITAFDRIQHAYKPNSSNYSWAIDVSKKYSLERTGYVFEGWYTKDGSQSGDWGKQWNFSSDRVTGDMTLYAKWETEIVFSYTLCFVDEEGNEVAFGSYRVQKDAKFVDEYNYIGSSLSAHDRTRLDDKLYSDKELSKLWNDDFTHPGGEESLDIRVYIKTIPGIWKIVSSFEQLKAAGDNDIWLTADIDCGGEELYLGDSRHSYNGKLQGNNHTISNFKIGNLFSSTSQTQFAIFRSLGAKAHIENVTFSDVNFRITAARDTTQIRAAALAITATDGCEVSNVTVKGTYTVGTIGTSNQNVQDAVNSLFESFKNIFDDENDKAIVSNFKAEITEQQD